MSQSIYTGNVPSARGLNDTPSVSLSGGGSASGIINSVTANVFMSTNAYSKTYAVTVKLYYGASYVSATRTDIKFTSSDYGGKVWEFSFATNFSVNDISSFALSAAADADKIFVKDDQSVTVDYSIPTACKAPTGAAFGKSLYETDPTLAYSGAKAGSFNAITGYEIQYAQSSDNSTWGAWTALKTVSNSGTSGSTTVTISPTRAYYRKYRIRTRGAAGAAYYSAWKETASVKRNSLPTPPTNFTASPAVYVSGPITLSYSGATDPDGNLSTHELQYSIKPDGGSYGAYVSIADGATSHTPTLSAGALIVYHARAVDALGAVSDWKKSNTCGKNTAPDVPTINFPQAGKTTYNSKPRFLITLGADPEEHLQTIAAEGFTASRSSNLESGSKVTLRKSVAASAGSVSISAIAADVYGEQAAAVGRSTTYALPGWTDALAAGFTSIKAVHMLEIREKVNTARAYYGLAAVDWADDIEAGITSMAGWGAHVQEIKTALGDIVTFIRDWDSTFSLPAWAAINGKQPQADLMQQLRAAVEML